MLVPILRVCVLSGMQPMPGTALTCQALRVRPAARKTAAVNGQNSDVFSLTVG